MAAVPSIARALTIAGSDSGGCAGIQADLKTFSALEVHGMSVITSVTAQDTRHVHMVSDLPLESIELQLEVVIEDIGVDAVKTGMLPTAEIIDLVARRLKHFRIERLVVDPVMVSTSGDPLIQSGAVDVLKRELFPLAMVVTPNLHECQVLTGRTISTQEELEKAARQIVALGPGSVVVKGGHLGDPAQATDYLFDGKRLESFSSPRLKTRNTHGSGCTFASAIAAYLARGLELRDAIARAKEYVTGAIEHSLSLGHGCGPLGHFWKQWNR